MYYNIKVINNINIEIIVIVFNRTEYPNRNDAGILVLNSDPDSHFVLAALSKLKTDPEIRSESNLPRKQNRENYRVTR